MKALMVIFVLALFAWLGFHGVISDLLGFGDLFHGGFGALWGISLAGLGLYWLQILIGGSPRDF